jgi:hypothetical protein
MSLEIKFYFRLKILYEVNHKLYDWMVIVKDKSVELSSDSI